MDRRVGVLALFSVSVSLIFVIRGIIEHDAGASEAGLLYVFWPLIYTFIVAGLTSRRVLVGAQRVLVLATIVIGVYGMSYVLVQLRVLPSSLFIPLFPQGEAIGLYSGYVESNLYSFNSFPFLIPFVMAALVTYPPSHPDPPVPRTCLWLSLALGLTLILVSGRRALFVVVPFAFLVMLVLKLFANPRAKRVTWRELAKLVFAVVVTSLAFAQYMSTVYDFSWAAVLRMVSSGFAFNSGGADLGAQIRSDQYSALIAAWAQSPVLGAGHGASVAGLVRDWERPWSYELYYVALLFQVGILGTLAYAAGVLWIYWRGVRILKEGGPFGELMLCNLVGLSGMLLVNATNPVLPRFDGLWALFLPISVINAWLLQPRHKESAIYSPSHFFLG